jgi:hypothetical protein
MSPKSIVGLAVACAVASCALARSRAALAQPLSSSKDFYSKLYSGKSSRWLMMLPGDDSQNANASKYNVVAGQQYRGARVLLRELGFKEKPVKKRAGSGIDYDPRYYRESQSTRMKTRDHDAPVLGIWRGGRDVASQQ